MAADRIIGTVLPNADFGEPDCCACLNGMICGDHADIICNECGAVIRTIAAGDVQQAFTEMELTLDLSSAICPHCGAANLFPGFSQT